MSEEETKEYLKRAEDLEDKLTGEDKDTYQWVLYGYSACARLLHEEEEKNKQLKEVIEEGREYIEDCSSREIRLDVIEILDKVKEVGNE